MTPTVLIRRLRLFVDDSTQSSLISFKGTILITFLNQLKIVQQLKKS